MLPFLEQNIDHYRDLGPRFDLQDYFSGKLKAWGIVQNLRGDVVQRLKIDMFGQWNGSEGSLSEDIKYFDGRHEKRTWKLIKHENGNFSGTAEGIIGQAKGRSSGCATCWNYEMIIPVDGKDMNVHFDDWMYTIDENLVVNRSYIKKFGIKVAEVSIFIQKESN
jgi:hypothetical protein